MSMWPVSGSISTSAMWTPLGKVSGVSVAVLVSRSSAIAPCFFSSAARAASSNSDDAAVGADHAEAAGFVDDVGFRRLQQHRRDALALLQHHIDRI